MGWLMKIQNKQEKWNNILELNNASREVIYLSLEKYTFSKCHFSLAISVVHPQKQNILPYINDVE